MDAVRSGPAADRAVARNRRAARYVNVFLARPRSHPSAVYNEARRARRAFSLVATSQRKFAAGLLAAASGLIVVGCRKRAAQAAPLPPVPVTVATAIRADVPNRVQAIGLAQAFSTISVKSQVDGQLQSADFRQGDYVHKGQVLFQIDPRPFRATLAQAEANLAKDLANAAEAKVEARRYDELAKDGVVSREQDDQMQASAQELAAAVQADRAAEQTARLNLNYCTIVSPVDGRTGALLIQPGNVAQSNTTVLVTINQIEPIYVEFAVPEQYLPLVREFTGGRKLAVSVHAQNDPTPDVGALSFVDNAVDPTTGTIKLMATFPNTARRLWPGEYVNADMTLAVEAGVIVVPQAAVMTGQDGPYVYVVTPQGRAENRDVTTGATLNGQTVIAKGLNAGDRVVTDGQVRLFPGAKVLIAKSSAAAASGQAAGPAASGE